MRKKLIFLLILPLLLGISVFVQLIEISAETPPLSAPQCADSDGGMALNAKGIVNITDSDGNSFTITEECENSDTINECYCAPLGAPENNYGKNQLGTYSCRNIVCPNGCQDGACNTSVPGCYDSDNGKNYFVKGYVSDGEAYFPDECADNGIQVHEGYCENSQWKDEAYSCPHGCKDGACLKETEKSITVTSPNGGEEWAIGETHDITWTSTGLDNANVRISVSYGVSGYTLTGLDIPITQGSWPWTIEVREFSNPSGGVAEFSTGDNIKISVTASLEHDPWSIFDRSDNYFSIIKEIGNLPPVIDELTAPTQLKVNQQGSWAIRAHDPENGILSYKVNWGDEIVSVPTSKTEKVIQTTIFTHSYNKAGTYTIAFTITDDHRQIAKTSTTVKVSGELQKCADTDGGRNYYLKGTVNGYESDLIHYGVWPDKCGTGGWEGYVLEQYCGASEKVYTDFFKCTNGCNNGACRSIHTGTFKIADIAGKKALSPNETATLTIKGVEPDGTPAELSEGFNVQWYIFAITQEKTYAGGNGRYADGYWHADIQAPINPGNYNLQIALYCARNDSECTRKYGISAQVEDWSLLTVSSTEEPAPTPVPESTPVPEEPAISELEGLKRAIMALKSEIQHLKEVFINQEKILVKEIDKILSSRLKGRILLQVEEKGEAWYVSPANEKKHYLGRPADAFSIMRNLGLGIKHSELENYLNSKFPGRLSGKILLDVEQNGEAYYINPDNLKGYYLNRPADAFSVMRELGLGITNNDIRKIDVGEIE